MSYQAGLDLGSTFTTVSMCQPDRAAKLEVLTPSVVFASPDGTFLVGEEAERRALTDPGRVARRFKRRIGDPTPLLIGDSALPAEMVAALFSAQLLGSLADRAGGPATRVAMTHPAGWGHYRLESLRTGLSAHGLADVLFVPEPQAAVRAHDSLVRLEPGAAVAVYDLGGGSFDAAVVRKLAADRFVLAGPPEEVEVGGLDFDEVVFSHVVASLHPAWDALDIADPAVLAAVAELRRSCTAAKEMLSADTEVLIPVVIPGIPSQEVRLGRTEFESMIRPAIEETVAALDRTLRAAAVAPHELAAVLLVGGASRIPLVTQEVSAQLGCPVTHAPAGMAALGAALEARGLEPEPAAVPTMMWERPPLPVAPSTLRPKRSWRKLTPLITAGLLTLAVAGGLAANSLFPRPVGADATTPPPTTTTAVETTEEPVVETSTVQTVAPPPAPASPPRMTTTTRPQPPRTTTTKPPTTTSPPPKSSTSKTTPPVTSPSTTKAGTP